MTWYMSLTPIMRKMGLLVGALLEEVRITNSHYIGWIFSRGRKDTQEVVSVHNYKSVGWTISLGKASLPVNSSGNHSLSRLFRSSAEWERPSGGSGLPKPAKSPAHKLTKSLAL